MEPEPQDNVKKTDPEELIGSEEEGMDTESYGDEEESEEDDDCMDAFEEDSSEEENEPELLRLTSKQIGREYHYQVLNKTRLFSALQSKIVSIKDRFEYLNLTDGIILKYLRDHHFLVEECCLILNDQAMNLMQKDNAKPAELTSGEDKICLIDYMPVEDHMSRDLGCGHRICSECWGDYLTNKIQEGPTSIHMGCPMEKCTKKITIDIVQELVDKNILALYEKFLLDDMVEKSPNFVFCLGKSCGLTFKCEDKFLTDELKLPQMDASCLCGSITCLKCKLKGHEPLSCEMFKEWDEGLQESMDQLNSTWKKNNTKNCPGCKTIIEKNQGCMHMTCGKCRHSFCWLCLGDWKKHGSGTGGYYKCNVYKPSDADTKGEQYLKRLQFFIDRYLEHKRGLEITDDKIKDHLVLLQGEEPLFYQKMKKSKREKMTPPEDFRKANKEITPGCLDFYITGLKFAAKCRSFIVYTYPIGFKILEGNESHLFTQTQYFLEYALEVLDKYFDEHPMKKLIAKNETGVCLSKEYSNIKAKIQSFSVNLGEQFKNAKKEFSDAVFLKKIDEKFKRMKDELLNKKIKITKTEKKGKHGRYIDWYCKLCTNFNHARDKNHCGVCGRDGRPAPGEKAKGKPTTTQRR